MGFLRDNALMQTVPEDDLGFWSYGGLPQASHPSSASMIQPPPQPAAPPVQDPRKIEGLMGALASQLQRQPPPQPQQRFANGGAAQAIARLRAMAEQPPMTGEGNHGPVAGPGSGREDKIEALLSDGEYVFDAETVSLLGDGSNDEGARRLDELRQNIRKHKGQNLARGEFSQDAKPPEAYLRGGL